MNQAKIDEYYQSICNAQESYMLIAIIKDIFFDGAIAGSMDSKVRDEAFNYVALRQSNDPSFGGRVAPSGGTNDPSNV